MKKQQRLPEALDLYKQALEIFEAAMNIGLHSGLYLQAVASTSTRMWTERCCYHQVSMLQQRHATDGHSRCTKRSASPP